MKEKLTQIIKNFKNKKVIVIGDLSLDAYIFGEIPKSNPEMPGAPLIKKTRNEYRLGCAANVASNLSSLDVKTNLFGIIGNDSAGKIFSHLCKNKKIKLTPFLNNETILKQRILEESHKHYVCRVDYGESSLLSAPREAINFFIKKIKKESPDAIILSDYNKGIFRGVLGKEIISWAKHKNIPTIIDPKPENYQKFTGATIINPNISEAKKIVNLESSTPEEIAKKLKELTNSKYVVITLGKDGMISYDGSFHKIPTQAQEVVDVVGAGDTATALLAVSLVSGAAITEAAQIANIGAGIVVEKLGTATVSTKELEERINESA